MEHEDGLPAPRRYWAMLAVGAAVTMAVLDGAVVNIALPTMARALHTDPANSVWIVNSYQLAIVISLLPVTALGERWGYRRTYLGGIALFMAASLGCALSRGMAELVAARAVQGPGAAAVMGINGAMVRFIDPNRLLGAGVGLNALVVSVASAIGPSLASAVLAVAHWPWLFAINVPIALVTLLVGARTLPDVAPVRRPVDGVSAGLNAVVFAALFLGVNDFTRDGTGHAVAGVGLALALVAGGLLFRRERLHARPLIPIDLLRGRVFALSVVASICAFASYQIVFLALPFHFESALHRDEVHTGLLMTAWPVALGLVAPVAGRLSDRVSAAALGTAGMALLTLGLVLVLMLGPHPADLDIAWRLAVCGLGFGFFQAPNNRTMLGSAPRDRAGAAGGMLATARLTGLTAGAAATALVLHAAAGRGEEVCLSAAAALAIAAGAASLGRGAIRQKGELGGNQPSLAKPASFVREVG